MNRNIVLALVFMFLFVANGFASEFKKADIFQTPNSINTNLFGGYVGGINTDAINWSIGNCVPLEGVKTKDVVVSGCDGDPSISANWTEKLRITQEGKLILSSPNGTRWEISVDDSGNLITEIE